MSASAFVEMVSSSGFLGDQLIRTQHFIGASKWRKVNDNLIMGHHQIRSTHHRFAEPIVNDNAEGVDAPIKAKSHVMAMITYVRIDGMWKWSGIETDIRWHDGRFVDVFRDFKSSIGRESIDKL